MKLLTKFFFKLKKTPIFGPFPQFLEQKKFLKKIWLCHAQQDKSFWHHAEIQRNLMIQFQENNRTDGTTKGWTDPILQYHYGYRRGSNKYNCSRLAFISQTVLV